MDLTPEKGKIELQMWRHRDPAFKRQGSRKKKSTKISNNF